MPRWKALPDELDPQVREFTSQLRRLVDRSGLSIAAVSDRTGYSKTSWERYLNGRLLAPKGAIVALAEVTGTNAGHLATMWELAERAWSRSEMRHDMTMEAIRISQARAALGEFGPAQAGAAGGPSGGSPGGGRTAAPAGPPPQRAPEPFVPDPQRDPEPFVPDPQWDPEPFVPDAATARAAGAAEPPPSAMPYVIPQQAGPGPGRQAPLAGPPGPPSGPGPGRQAPPAGPPGTPSSQGRGKRKVTLFLGGVVGALLVIAAAVLLTDLGGDGDDSGRTVAKSPSVTPTTSSPPLPAGIKCSGADCTGQDPEAMGCGGRFATTVSTATVGKAVVEVRYSKTCGAAWARITQAAPGDTVQITVAGKGAQNGVVDADNDAYTPMAAAPEPAEAKACATLKTGATGCTVRQ